MSYRVTLDAGETRVVTWGFPLKVVSNLGPGALLVEGEVRRPEEAWAPETFEVTAAVVTAVDETTIEVR